MFGLEKVADSFDRMHAEVQRDYDRVMLEESGQFAGKTFGPDSWLNYFFAVPNSISWALGTFVMAQGKALVDALRLGEGVKSQSLGGVAEDALRVLTLIPAVGAGAKLSGYLGKSVRIFSAARVAGQQGARSCGPTAIAVAGRISGQASAMTLGEVGAVLGKGHPNLATFPGMFLQEMRTTLNALTLTSQELNLAGEGTAAVAELASGGKGPVIFGVQWWETVGGVTRPATRPLTQFATSKLGQTLNPNGITRMVSNAGIAAEAPEHWLTAFRSGGRVMVADQYGIRPIADLGKIGGSTSPFAVSSRAFLVPEGVLLSRFSSFGANISNQRWLASTFAINMVVVNAPQFWAMDAAVQNARGKEPRRWPGMPDAVLDALVEASASTGGSSGGQGGQANVIPTPTTIPAPNPLSPTLDQDTKLVLSKMPRSGSREYSQLRLDTGLPDSRLRNALLQLVSAGLLQATHWFELNGQATPSMVRRGITTGAE